MKEWIVELCPEISEWQADMIAEAVYNSVRDEREACIRECVRICDRRGAYEVMDDIIDHFGVEI
jgi:hypothetical protein